jgi:hypothetical protein
MENCNECEKYTLQRVDRMVCMDDPDEPYVVPEDKIERESCGQFVPILIKKPIDQQLDDIRSRLRYLEVGKP